MVLPVAQLENQEYLLLLPPDEEQLPVGSIAILPRPCAQRALPELLGHREADQGVRGGTNVKKVEK